MDCTKSPTRRWDNWAKKWLCLVLADKLALDVLRQARVTAYKRLRATPSEVLAEVTCSHPLSNI